jgi:hypothetical protein
LEYYYNYLRILNSRYFNNFIDFSAFSFVEPNHIVQTHLDAEIVKSSIDLAVSDNAIGVKYSELYQYEDLGRVATEQYLFDMLDGVFLPYAGTEEVRLVTLTDDSTLAHKHTNL